MLQGRDFRGWGAPAFDRSARAHQRPAGARARSSSRSSARGRGCAARARASAAVARPGAGRPTPRLYLASLRKPARKPRDRRREPRPAARARPRGARVAGPVRVLRASRRERALPLLPKAQPAKLRGGGFRAGPAAPPRCCRLLMRAHARWARVVFLYIRAGNKHPPRGRVRRERPCKRRRSAKRTASFISSATAPRTSWQGALHQPLLRRGRGDRACARLGRRRHRPVHRPDRAQRRGVPALALAREGAASSRISTRPRSRSRRFPGTVLLFTSERLNFRAERRRRRGHAQRAVAPST